MFSLDVEGFPELVKKIQGLSEDRGKRREILGLLRSTAGATVRAAKANAPISSKRHTARKKTISPGNLMKSIGTITGRKGNSAMNPTIYVGPRVRGTNDGWYGNMVEAGHNIYKKGFKRSRKAGSARNVSGARKRVEGKFYMRKTYEQTKGQVTAESEKKVARYIQRRIDALSR